MNGNVQNKRIIQGQCAKLFSNRKLNLLEPPRNNVLLPNINVLPENKDLAIMFHILN